MSSSVLKARRVSQQGFSLTELMIVIVVIGVLMGLVFSNMDTVDKARGQKASQEIGKLMMGLEQYRSDNGGLPPSGALNALSVKPGNASVRWKQYMVEIPKDPWGNDYRYLNPGTHGKSFEVYSIGADGKEGTADDIGSWSL